MKGRFEKHAYTLLADDNVPLASDPARRRNLKAHIILSVLTNSTLMFSDNQIVASRNLRDLLRHDGTVRHLVRDKVLSFALRSEEQLDTGTPGCRLTRTQKAFLSEGKLRLDPGFLSGASEYKLVLDHGNILEWSYWDVRNTFTQTCKRLLLSDRTRETLGDEAFSRLEEAVLKEEERDRGLGRAFLQFRLPDILTTAGVVLSDEQRRFLLNCSDAPYLSNLPSVLRRTPIYDTGQAPSFELLRGPPHRFEDVDAPVRLPTKLDAEHFVEGLIRFTIEDIWAIRASSEFNEFIRLSSSDVTDFKNFVLLREAYELLNLLIDDRIYSGFPELRGSNSMTARTLRSKVAICNRGVGVTTDLLALAITIPGLEWGINLIKNAAFKRARLDEESIARLDAAQRNILRKDLVAHLNRQGLAGTIAATEDPVLTDTYPSETVVVA